MEGISNKILEGYIIVKDKYAIRIVCLNSLVDTSSDCIYSCNNMLVDNLQRTYTFNGFESTKPVPYKQIMSDIGYANAHTELHTAYNNIHDEIAQLESYKNSLEHDIKILEKTYNREVAAMKEYEKWYKAVTEFDKDSYAVWCQMQHDLACTYMNFNDEQDTEQ